MVPSGTLYLLYLYKINYLSQNFTNFKLHYNFIID